MANVVPKVIVQATGAARKAQAGDVLTDEDGTALSSATPAAHAASHTDGTDDIQSATSAQKGLATAAQITKLDGIATGANAYAHPNHSGDVTSVADGSQTIALSAVTLAKMADMATASILGRNTAGTGVPEALTAAQALAIVSPLTTKGDLRGFGTADARVPIGATSGHVLTVDPAQALGLKWAAAPGASSGKLAQVSRANTGTAFSTASTIPLDDTVPTSSEGAQFTTQSITPTNSGSTLILKVSLQISSTTNDHAIATLLNNSNTVVAVGIVNSTAANGWHSLVFWYSVAAGGTSLQTWKVRVGSNTGNTIRINQQDSGPSRIFGGACASSFEIWEILP